jgi:hypothetical protein
MVLTSRLLPGSVAGPLAGLVAGVVVALAVSAGCEPAIDCNALCARTLACEVTFGPSDDPDGSRVQSGERTDAESCALGCEESPRVTVDNARCIDSLAITGDAAACQPQVMECLGLAEQVPLTPAAG